MQYALIGERLAHSFSPELHRSFGRYDYACLELAPSELGSFLKARRFEGLNVTIPYKQAVIPYLDRLDPRAAAIGAVNTVVKRDGLLWGYNTDYGGMAEAICHLLAHLSAGQSPALAGKTLLILGTGGSSKTALAVCAALGATEVFRVSRREQAGVLSYEQLLKRFGGPRPSAGPSAPEAPRQLVILNCTPVGMFPDWERLPLRPAALPGLVDDQMAKLQFSQALSEIWKVIGECNKYIDQTQPWVLGKDPEKKGLLGNVLLTLAECVRLDYGT